MASVKDEIAGEPRARKLPLSTLIFLGLAVYGVLLYCLVERGA